jgi:hypothetical protein
VNRSPRIGLSPRGPKVVDGYETNSRGTDRGEEELNRPVFHFEKILWLGKSDGYLRPATFGLRAFVFGGAGA